MISSFYDSVSFARGQSRSSTRSARSICRRLRASGPRHSSVSRRGRPCLIFHLRVGYLPHDHRERGGFDAGAPLHAPATRRRTISRFRKPRARGRSKCTN